MVDVAKGVIELVSGKVRNKQGPLQMSDALESLGLESLDVLELTFAIEEKFNIEIPFNANEAGTAGISFTTAGDVIDAVAQLVAEQKGEKA